MIYEHGGALGVANSIDKAAADMMQRQKEATTKHAVGLQESAKVAEAFGYTTKTPTIERIAVALEKIASALSRHA